MPDSNPGDIQMNDEYLRTILADFDGLDSELDAYISKLESGKSNLEPEQVGDLQKFIDRAIEIKKIKNKQVTIAEPIMPDSKGNTRTQPEQISPDTHTQPGASEQVDAQDKKNTIDADSKEAHDMTESAAEVAETEKKAAADVREAAEDANKENKEEAVKAEKAESVSNPTSNPTKLKQDITNTLKEWKKKHISSNNTGGSILWHYEKSHELTKKLVDNLKSLLQHQMTNEEKQKISQAGFLIQAIHKVWTDDFNLTDAEKQILQGKTHDDCIKIVESALPDIKTAKKP